MNAAYMVKMSSAVSGPPSDCDGLYQAKSRKLEGTALFAAVIESHVKRPALTEQRKQRKTPRPHRESASEKSRVAAGHRHAVFFWKMFKPSAKMLLLRPIKPWCKVCYRCVFFSSFSFAIRLRLAAVLSNSFSATHSS